MARLNGILKIEGTIQDLTFYKTQDGHLVRSKGGVSGARIASDPAFARTRENGAEFGSSATAGKILRDTLRTMTATSSDGRVTARITQLMTQLKNLDDSSVRGERSVALGIAKPEGKALLKNFNFNDKAALGAVLFKAFSVDSTTGVISIADFVPVNDVKNSSGATHINIKGGYAIIDFETGISTFELTNSENLPIDAVSTSVTLTPAAVPTGTGIKFFLLQLEYFQEVNGLQYSLKTGAYNALAIIEVL